MSNTILYKNKNPAPEYCYILRDGTFYMVSWPSKGLDPGGLSPTSCHIMFRGTTRIENGSMQKPKLHS